MDHTAVLTKLALLSSLLCGEACQVWEGATRFAGHSTCCPGRMCNYTLALITSTGMIGSI